MVVTSTAKLFTCDPNRQTNDDPWVTSVASQHVWLCPSTSFPHLWSLQARHHHHASLGPSSPRRQGSFIKMVDGTLPTAYGQRYISKSLVCSWERLYVPCSSGLFLALTVTVLFIMPVLHHPLGLTSHPPPPFKRFYYLPYVITRNLESEYKPAESYIEGIERSMTYHDHREWGWYNTSSPGDPTALPWCLSRCTRTL